MLAVAGGHINDIIPTNKKSHVITIASFILEKFLFKVSQPLLPHQYVIPPYDFLEFLKFLGFLIEF